MATSGDEVARNDGVGAVRTKKPSTKDTLATLEARLDTMEEVMTDRLNQLVEALVGPNKPENHVGNFFTYFTNLVFRVEELEEKVEAFEEQSKVARNAHLETLEKKIASMELELELCKKAIVASGGVGASAPRKKVRTPEPKSYNGARDAREIDNFLWSMERYFDNESVEEGRKGARGYNVPYGYRNAMVEEKAHRHGEGVVQDRDLGRVQAGVEEALLSRECGILGISEASQVEA